MTRGNWILEGTTPRQVDALEWARWFETAKRHVADDRVGDYRVSTVFIGIDHRFEGEGPPLLFETMVFKKDGSQADLIDRYATWDEAIAGHARTFAAVIRRGQSADVDT